MTYSRQDIFRRIKATLPVRWFGENTPVLDLILNTLSAGWVGVFVLLDYVGIQTRAATAVDQWLDLVARDFFDQRLLRRSQETDGPFRRRILAELIRDRCTRSAIYDLLLDVTGKPPVIFEPTNPQDTGCYSTLGITEGGSAAYCNGGGWGSLNCPFQAFVKAYRPAISGSALINGWGGALGAFGGGRCVYIASNTDLSLASDSEIYSAVARSAPAGTIIWMSFE